VLLTFALSLGFLPLLSAGELAWTDADTETKPARHTIDSPDGAGCIRMLPVENLRSVEDVCTTHRQLLFTSGKLIPYAAYASELGNLANLGSWSGSSRYALVFTGLHHDQEMALVYPDGDHLAGKALDIAPIFKHGAEVLPGEEGALAHDAILEVVPGRDDSFVALLWRTASGKGVAIPVYIHIANRERPTELTYEYGTPKFQDMGSGQPLPTLASLGIK